MLDILQEFEKKIAAKRLELEEEENALKVFKRLMGITEINKADDVSVIKNKEDIKFDDLFSGDMAFKRRFLVDDIRELVQKFGTKEFTVAIVHKALIQQGAELDAKSPRPRIATALGKLVDEGTLELLFKGAGNKPHIYKVKDKVKEEAVNKDFSGLI